MNITVILIETLVLIVLFTIAVAAGSKNPVDTVCDMPQQKADYSGYGGSDGFL